MRRDSISLGSLFLMGVLLSACGGGGGGSAQNVEGSPVQSDTATVIGSVLAASNSDVDSDVNDTLAPFAENDSFNSAQVLTNFSILGGYLNQPGQGATGRSFNAGDINDFFEINLVAGQSITLIMAESAANNDIDLTLFDDNQVVVDQSMNNARGECVENVAGGRHFVRANILRGASNYTLSVTSLPCAATFSSANLRLSTDFRQEELLLGLSDYSSEVAMRTELDTMAMDMKVMSHRLYAKVTMRNIDQVANKMGLAKSDDKYATKQISDKAVTLTAIKALQQHAEFEYVEPNYIYRSFETANDTFFSRQWHYPLINLPQAWQQAVGGSGAVVAVLDTGVLTAHPDLAGNLLPGYDFVSRLVSANDGDGRDPDPNDPGDSLLPGFSSYHGTHVSGTVGAIANNSFGVSGASFFSNINVMPLRVLGTEGGAADDICEAVLFAAGLQNATGLLPSVSADVINMSLGSSGNSQAFQLCIDAARNAGVILVAAAGNFSSSAPQFPAANNGVVSVSAANISRNLANYSSFGPTIDVSAPGGEATDVDGDGLIDAVFSTIGDEDANQNVSNSFGYLIGTSMAAPHVSAVAALMKSVRPSLTPSQFDTLLSAGELTDDIGVPGRDDSFGFGLINANKAVLAAQGVSLLNPLLSVAPSGINFGLSDTVAEINVQNVGGGDLVVNSFSENSGGWLTINAPVGGEGIYTISADRNSPLLANPGTMTATISFSSNAGDINVPVLIQIPQFGQQDSANAGVQFVLLISATGTNAIRAVAVRPNNGRYDFRFDDVPADTYMLFTGTDNDNDFSVCDGGEACGALGSFDEPLDIQVDAGGEINVGSFFTSFNFGTGISSSSVRTENSAEFVLPQK